MHEIHGLNIDDINVEIKSKSTASLKCMLHIEIHHKNIEIYVRCESENPLQI